MWAAFMRIEYQGTDASDGLALTESELSAGDIEAVEATEVMEPLADEGTPGRVWVTPGRGGTCELYIGLLPGVCISQS